MVARANSWGIVVEVGGVVVADDKTREQLENEPQTDVEQPHSHAADQATEPVMENPPFLGSYDHTIDGKGRIIVPAIYRKNLGERFAIGPTRDVSAIALYPLSVWWEVLRDLNTIRQSTDASLPHVQRYLNQFAKYVFPDSESDAQGRILLPAKLRSRFLGDAKEVEISGSFDHIKVIVSATADEEDAAFDDSRETTMASIADILGKARQGV